MPVLPNTGSIPTDGFPRNVFEGAGAPAANAFAGAARIGSEYVNTTTGVRYVCTATNGTSTATWTILGPGAGP